MALSMVLDDSPLGKIAPEIRLNIYEMVLSHRGALRKPRKTLRGLTESLTESVSSNLGLLTTCRLIYKESIEKLYQQNTFNLSRTDVVTLAMSSPQCTFITAINITGRLFYVEEADEANRMWSTLGILSMHCTALEIVWIGIAGRPQGGDEDPGDCVDRLFEKKAYDGVGKWMAASDRFPGLLVSMNHEPIIAAWDSILKVPPNATLDEYIMDDGRAHTRKYWFDRRSAILLLSIEAYWRREDAPGGTAVEGARCLIYDIEARAKAAVDAFPEGCAKLQLRQITQETEDVILAWITAILWVNVKLVEFQIDAGLPLV